MEEFQWNKLEEDANKESIFHFLQLVVKHFEECVNGIQLHILF